MDNTHRYIKKTLTYGFETWTVFSQDFYGVLESNTFMSWELASMFYVKKTGRLPVMPK